MENEMQMDWGAQGAPTPAGGAWEGTLIVTPYAGYDGELRLRRRGESRVRLVVHLPPAQALVLFILKKAWDADADDGRRPRDRRGFRSKVKIAAHKQLLDSKVENDAIKVCIGRLRHTIRMAWESAGLPGDPPELVQTRRNLGYRLGIRLVLQEDSPDDLDAED